MFTAAPPVSRSRPVGTGDLFLQLQRATAGNNGRILRPRGAELLHGAKGRLNRGKCHTKLKSALNCCRYRRYGFADYRGHHEISQLVGRLVRVSERPGVDRVDHR